MTNSAEMAAAPAPALTTVATLDQVSKWFGPVIGVNDVTCELQPGITGLLGSNGAGKTTLIKLIIGQLRPTLGQIRICGVDAWSSGARRLIGYCPEADVFYEEMSGRQFVRTMAGLHGMSRADATTATERALAEVEMTDRADRRLRGCSKGMRQRIKLAQALVHRPQLLVVDEPLNGVDPVGRRVLMDLFRKLADQGTAILVSSHILGEMDELADRVMFMGRGRMLATGSLQDIRDLFADQPLQVRIGSATCRELAAELITWPFVQSVQLTNKDRLELQITRPTEFFERLTGAIVDNQFQINSLETTDVTAEATFQYVMSAATRF